MKYHCNGGLFILIILLSLLDGLHAQPELSATPGPILSTQTISILGDELYLHGGSRSDTFLESNCSSEFWRLRLGRQTSWNLSSIAWETVPLREDSNTLPPVSGMGLKTMIIPFNNTISLVNGTSNMVQNASPYMVEFGRAGCADDNDRQESEQGADAKPWIGFNIYNPVMNTWESIDIVNTTVNLGFNTTAALEVGNFLSPTVAVDYVKFAWYIILQSTVPLRQVILRKDLATLTTFMSELDLPDSPSTLFPTQLLYEGWSVVSILNENAPFVDKGVATIVRDQIIIISGTANSFTPGDADKAELRGCDHAYIFSTVRGSWARQDLTVMGDNDFPETREKAAFLAVGSKIYMHGGVKPYQTVLNDLWVLDTDQWAWTRAPDGPGPRADHTLLQYHEYLLAVSGFDMGRNVPVTSVLPIMAYDTNATAWTDIIRPTIDEETSFVTNITRAAIIIGTIIFGMILLFIAGSTQYLRKWNQRNYVKVAENYELDDQQVRTGQNLPSILKKKYISQDGGDHNAKYSKGHGKDRDQGKRRKSQAQVIFEDEEGEYNDDDGYTGDEGDDSFSDDSSGGQKVQKVSLLSRPQANLTSRVPKRVRIAEHVDQSDDIEDEHSEEVENEEGQVIVQMPSDMPVE